MSLNGTVWAPIGPSPIDQGAISANGQVTAIAVHPSNANIIYIGTAWGGVWLTRDGGLTWIPIFDRAPSLGIGEPGGIAIDLRGHRSIPAGRPRLRLSADGLGCRRRHRERAGRSEHPP